MFSYNPNPPRYLLYRALGALVPYIVGTWGVRVTETLAIGALQVYDVQVNRWTVRATSVSRGDEHHFGT